VRLKHSSRLFQAGVCLLTYSIVVSICAPFAMAGGGLSFNAWLRSQAGSHGNGSRSSAPEATFPDLNEIRRRPNVRPHLPTPVSSSIRSRLSPLVPRNGRRVGDSLPVLGANNPQSEPFNNPSMSGRAIAQVTSNSPTTPVRVKPVPEAKSRRMRSHHAYRPAPPLSDSQYTLNFFQWTLLRQPDATESSYWDDITRAAYAHGQGSPVLAFRELGKTLFESAQYAARARSDRLHA